VRDRIVRTIAQVLIWTMVAWVGFQLVIGVGALLQRAEIEDALKGYKLQNQTERMGGR
jgi:hypothetical protein